MDAPEDLTWSYQIADEDEPGERLILEGTVYMNDGKTPAEGVLVYAYHTNSDGLYSKKGNETGNGKRHGYLRGWVRTGRDGKYRFETIKPTPYPSRIEPAHVHITLSGEQFQEYWIVSTLFEGDDLITSEIRKKHSTAHEGSGIIQLKRESGTWYGIRNIKLK